MGTKAKSNDWWPGGHIRRGKRRDVYVIERRVAGVHFHVSTRASTYQAAMKHLERFEADPDNYSPAGGNVALALTAELVLEYRDWQLETGKAEAPWAKSCARMLAKWATALAGKDLTQLNLQKDIKPALATWKTSRPQRVIAIKGFFKWLRREKGLLKHHQDVTLDLAVPKLVARKMSRPRNVELEHVRAVAALLPKHIRDILILQMGTGWHVSEVRRFALRGELLEVQRGDGVLAVLITGHKGKRLTRTPLKNAEHLEAAKRLKAGGRFWVNETIGYHLRRACDAAGVKRFGLGSMRHSVSTWAIEGGARMAEIAEFFEHRSPNTTSDHYANAAVPTVSIPVHTLDERELH